MNGCHLTQVFGLEPVWEVPGHGGSRSGGGAEVSHWSGRGGMDLASACPPPLPVLFFLFFFALLTELSP